MRVKVSCSTTKLPWWSLETNISRNRYSLLIAVGLAHMNNEKHTFQVYSECKEYVKKNRPALISSSDILKASNDSLQSLPSGILTLGVLNQTIEKRILDAVLVAQLNLFNLHETFVGTNLIPQRTQPTQLFTPILKSTFMEAESSKRKILKEVEKLAVFL